MFQCHNCKPDLVRLIYVALVLILSGCDPSNLPDKNEPKLLETPRYSEAELQPGGNTTVSIKPFPSFQKPAQNLPATAKPDFYAGRALADQPWIKAPASTTARDGLGPLYNARTCLACHVNGGRGTIPDDNRSALFSTLVRVSISDPQSKDIITHGVNIEPAYGDQLQTQSVSLAHQLRNKMTPKPNSHEPVPEASVHVNWTTKEFHYPDRQKITLRSPELDIRNLGYGPMHPNIQKSIRLAPAIHGMGLLELISQKDIDALSDAEDKNLDGISGRVNQVWDEVTGKTVPGRFGHKASRPNLTMVVAAAFANDIGINNPLFKRQPCSPVQKKCASQAHGEDENGFELPEHLLQLVVNFNRNLGVPARRNSNKEEIIKGRELFYQSGCANCHKPSYVTDVSEEFPHLSQQTIWPYTDLLLHDMGPDLADDRPDFEASGSEWRTPPLWGIGLSQSVNGSRNLLHDGRAKSIEEAILWHGGEAESAKKNFSTLPSEKRTMLMQFVESL